MANEDTHYHLLRLLEDNPEASQRELTEAMGVSVGKMNYLLRGLLDKGLVKARNFHRSDNKRGYLDQLTPTGVAEKVRVTRRYLARRRAEIEAQEGGMGQRGIMSPRTFPRRLCGDQQNFPPELGSPL